MCCQDLIVSHAKENNLKDISVRIPKNKLVFFTGVSGSGKSSLVFHTIAAEAQRQLYEMFPLYVRNRLPKYEKPQVESLENLSPVVVVDQRTFMGDIRSTVGTMTDTAPLLRLLFSRCAKPRLNSSRLFSFNDPQGMCRRCSGLGKIIVFDQEKLFDQSKSLNQGAILFPGHKKGSYQWQMYANAGFLDADKPLKDYSSKEWFDFLHGRGIKVDIENTTGTVWDESYKLTYEGFLDRIERLYLKKDIERQSERNRKIIKDYTREEICPQCGGSRLNEAAGKCRLNGKTLMDIGNMEIRELRRFLKTIADPLGMPTVRKLLNILEGMEELGLDYLNLNRESASLSRGELQRLKIVRHLGSSLTGLIYIFDEPSTGLHPKDMKRLEKLFLRLREQGNSVYVVEHRKELIGIADEVIELGPEGGKAGGRIVFQGDIPLLMKAKTATAAAINARLQVKENSRPWKDFLLVEHAALNNLKNITVKIPLGVMTVVTGVAGSGKSSLICKELPKRYPRITCINASPVGRTPRSTPATYTGVMDEIRKLFAKANHTDPSVFSSHSKGACPGCKGRGLIKTEMAFMDSVEVECEECKGTGYRKEVLQYRLKNYTIVDVLRMTVDEAANFFSEDRIKRKLKALQQVGMGYITLGQPVSTMSGGECQRLKLASHLEEKNGIYVMDEPSSGLHDADVKALKKLLNDMVDRGNTMILIEHNMEMAVQADWIIDMGPGGGEKGGRIIFEGTPLQLLSHPASCTAETLREMTGIKKPVF